MKDLKVSKELIEEVMKDKGTFETININKNELSTFGVLGHHIFSINIYEFAFKCKEWALKQGYFIYSTNELSFIKTFSLETIETFSNGKDTEIECILKACEYILNNKKD